MTAVATGNLHYRFNLPIWLNNLSSFLNDPASALREYQERGFHVETDVFSPEECDALVAAALPLLEGSETSRPIMHPHRKDPLFLRTMADRRLVEIMQLICGGPVYGLQSELFFGRPGTKGFAAHQDNFFVQAPDNMFASAWLALVDVDQNNGGLVFYPGSHMLGKLDTVRQELPPDDNQDPNAFREKAQVPAEIEPADVILKRGSVVFIHGWAVHESHDNATDGWRYALLNTYLRQGAEFRPGGYAKRSEVRLDEVAQS